MKNKQEVIEIIKNNTDEFSRFGVNRIGIFGSYLSDNSSPESDVDLLVEFKQGQKNFQNFMGTANLAENILDKEVDLVTPEGLSPHIGPHILKNIEYVQIS